MSASRETLISLFYKVAAIGVTFVGVSLLVRNLGSTAYGAWATLVSALVWIQLSDFGIGIVVRNRVAADRGNPELAQSIATAMTLTGAIGLALVIVFAATWRFISVARDFPLESALLYVSAFLMLPTSVGTNILQGLGLSRVTFQASLVQMALWLAFVAWLGPHPSITVLAVGFAVLWAGVCLYQLLRALRELDLANRSLLARLANVRPSRDVVAMMRIGGAFFVLQVTSLVLFNLGTYLSYTSFSPAAAAKYDILNKVYQIPLTLFNVVITVAWSRISQAASARDAAGLHRIQLGLVGVAVAGTAGLFLTSAFVVRPFVQLYSHAQIEVSMREVMAFSVQVAIQLLAYAGAVFMNAVERLRMQILFAVASALLFVPTFQVLKAAGLDVASVPLSTAFVMLPGALWFNLYVRRRIIRPFRLPA
jgi:O-antigen/teichoic acid export membrane protein